jgi:hypothetical protein
MTRRIDELVTMDRPLSPYQVRRREEERLGAIAFVLSLAAAVLFILITVQAAGYHVPMPLAH